MNKQNPSFYPQLTFMPQVKHNTPYVNKPQITPQIQHTPRPYSTGAIPKALPPKPQPKPEPMDIDQSMRTRNVNYMNRPAQNNLVGKRPPVEQYGQNPVKHQRNFHIEEVDQAYYDQSYNYAVEDPPEEYQAYSQDDYQQGGYEEPGNYDPQTELIEHSDVHFLG